MMGRPSQTSWLPVCGGKQHAGKEKYWLSLKENGLPVSLAWLPKDDPLAKWLAIPTGILGLHLDQKEFSLIISFYCNFNVWEPHTFNCLLYASIFIYIKLYTLKSGVCVLVRTLQSIKKNTFEGRGK